MHKSPSMPALNRGMKSGSSQNLLNHGNQQSKNGNLPQKETTSKGKSPEANGDKGDHTKEETSNKETSKSLHSVFDRYLQCKVAIDQLSA